MGQDYQSVHSSKLGYVSTIAWLDHVFVTWSLLTESYYQYFYYMLSTDIYGYTAFHSF